MAEIQFRFRETLSLVDLSLLLMNNKFDAKLFSSDMEIS